MSQPVTPFSFQYEVNSGLTLGANIVSKLLQVCHADNVQPIVIAPLELFGDALMVDKDRLQVGSQVLSIRRNVIWKPLISILPPDTATIFKDNFRLTSAFLFATGCSVIHNVDDTSKIMFEMMTLGGLLNRYTISPGSLYDVLETLNGSRDYFSIFNQSPFTVYKDFCDNSTAYMVQENTWVAGLYDENDTRLIAKLFFEAFETLKKPDVFLQAEGSKGGMLIAFLFIWLRPKETMVFLAHTCVYPHTPSQEDKKPRVMVHLQNSPLYSKTPWTGDWVVRKWEATASVAQHIKIDDPTQHVGLNPLSPSPWTTSRHQMQLLYEGRQSITNAIGLLSGALIEVITESGRVRSEASSQTLALQDICSQWYLNAYPTIMQKFGWDGKYVCDNARQKNIAFVLKDNLQLCRGLDYSDTTKAFKNFIAGCFDPYERRFGKRMIVADGLDEDMMEHAIHFAAQAVVSSFYREPLQNLTYWPLQPGLLRENSELLLQMMLLPSWDGQDHKKQVTVWTLRNRAIHAAIPSVKNIHPNDLAVAGDGYVAFASVLVQEDCTPNFLRERTESDRAINLSDRRLIATIEVFPGCIRQHGEMGSYKKLTEGQPQPRLAGRSITNVVANVNFRSADGRFAGVPEEDATNGSEIEIKHFIARDHIQKALLLTTNLEIQDQQGSIMGQRGLLVPASWRRSIEAILFAHHVSEYTSRLPQLEHLINELLSKGVSIEWCPIGHCLGRGRYILTTSGKKECRFFEAGNIEDDTRTFIRHGLVPLTHCVKVAMENCTDEQGWVVIA